MKGHRWLILPALLVAVSTAVAAEPTIPPYLLEARMMIEQAKAKGAALNDSEDEVLIGANFLRNAEAEFKKNVSWSGTLDEKAEPTVRYYSAMARLHAAIVVSRAGKVDQEKERLRLEGLAEAAKAKIKVFEDKNAEIALLGAEVAKRERAAAEMGKEFTERKAEIEQLKAKVQTLSAEATAKIEALNAEAATKVAALSAEVAARKTSLAAAEARGNELERDLAARQALISDLEKKGADLAKAVELARAENSRLQGEMATLAAKKGAEVSESMEKLQAMNRSQQFMADVGKLGGVIKTGTDNLTAIFPRASILKATGKNITVTPEGEKLGLALADLLTTYREYRVVIRVHGFGQPSRTEDAAATDQMGRVLREVATGKGKLDPAAIESLGVGSSDPAYAKSNPEGNRRVELVFLKRSP